MHSNERRTGQGAKHQNHLQTPTLCLGNHRGHREERRTYDQTFIKIAQNAEEAIESFVHKILEITQQVYRHERMLIPMEKLEGMKKAEFDTATRCYICHDPFKGIAKRKGG